MPRASFDRFLSWLSTAPTAELALAALAENVLLLLLALGAGALLVRAFGAQRVAGAPPPITGREVRVAATVVLLNSAVTVAGAWLWRAGIIVFRDSGVLAALLDAVVLLALMDGLMYALHRLAHHPLVFDQLHALHHQWERPRPLTLFVMHPLENLAFGLLWLALLALYPASWAGMSLYLAANLAFGTLSHLGVEPLPRAWAATPVARWLGGATFHARHHQHLDANFGFYTLVWDRLFGTLRNDHQQSFGRLPGGP